MTIGPITGAQREKIAILGGGIGALSAAWHLSSEAGWQERFDICVYQHGWRLGGSAAQASTWYGFYANAFSMLRAAHERLETPPARWRDGLCERAGIAISAGGGAPWPLVFPVLPGEPGTGSPATMWQMAMALLGLVGRWLDELAALGGGAGQGADAGRSYRLLAALARTMPDDSRKHPAHQHLLMAQALDGMRARLRAGYANTAAAGAHVQRLRACLETGSTVLKGLFADAVLIKGFDAINGAGLHAWLAGHGGHPELCLGSWPVRAGASLFAPGGRAQDSGAGQGAEAGTVLRAVLRMGLGYKGSIAYEMPAGVGDTFAAPLYRVLAGRGVKFRFFHRVEELVPDGEEVATIRITRQAALRDGRYNPLAKDTELCGWPRTPHYAQLDAAQAVLLQEREVDLEAASSDWPQLYLDQFGQPLPELELRRGRDFDKVVFGIGAVALPALCPQLLARSAPLKAAAEQASVQYRLAADGAGFSNLYLAGDWIKTGLDVPCAESAVMGGMQASRALGGYPKFIEGESDV